ncbi:MAG: nuclear transport factor 2 family protein [Acidimicrobiia bacterium]
MGDLLADRLAVGDVIIKYADSVDVPDMDRYATCFTDDVVVTGFTPEPLEGLAVYMPWVTAARARYSHTHHLIGNIQVVLDGDRARLRSYVQATHELPEDPDHLMVLWAAYDDDLVRTADGWQITRHHIDRLVDRRRIPVVGHR